MDLDGRFDDNHDIVDDIGPDRSRAERVDVRGDGIDSDDFSGGKPG